MHRQLHDFEGVQVDEVKYALLAPIIERTRGLLIKAQKEGGLKVGRPDEGPLEFGPDFERILSFPSPPDSSSGYVKVTAVKLSQVLNMMLVQAGSICEHGRPGSIIQHYVGPLETYYQCGHSDPPHYWDVDGNYLDARP